MVHRRALFGSSIAFAIALVAPLKAQAAAIYAVTYIELRASAVPAGRQIMKSYAANSHKENGNLLFELLEESGRPSRFAILEAWNDRHALDKHTKIESASGILKPLKAMRVAPDDRRVYESLFASAPSIRSPSGSIYVMTHVDVMPPYQDACAVLLKVMRSETIQDHGNIAYNVLRQDHELNHFTVAEVWVSRAAFEEHVGASHTVAFRQKLLPMTGALYDERLFTRIQ